MFDGEEYTSLVAEECFAGLDTVSKKKLRGSKNKRRFSDDQIRSLETMFENETKLEPRKKLQLARELGLQPRQVAIWFQNKRARWKSKQLERDYGILLSNYNSLSSQFENLKKEKQSLIVQLQKLNDLVEKAEKEGQCCSGREMNAGNSTDRESDNEGNIKNEVDVSPSLRLEHGVGSVLSDDDSSIINRAGYFGLEEETGHDLLNMVEPADSSLTSPEDWGRLDSQGLLDQSSTSSYHWWDFWS